MVSLLLLGKGPLLASLFQQGEGDSPGEWGGPVCVHTPFPPFHAPPCSGLGWGEALRDQAPRPHHSPLMFLQFQA